jgi:hypothetical protein
MVSNLVDVTIVFSLTGDIEHDDAKNDKQYRTERASQSPYVPPDAVQQLHKLAVLSSAPQLFLIAVAHGQTSRDASEVFGEESLVPGGEATVSLDLCTSRLRRGPSNIM